MKTVIAAAFPSEKSVLFFNHKALTLFILTQVQKKVLQRVILLFRNVTFNEMKLKGISSAAEASQNSNFTFFFLNGNPQGSCWGYALCFLCPISPLYLTLQHSPRRNPPYL